MQTQPLVSVIIPTYNREKLLPRAINSVLNQTYPNWELIIVDDRSTDNTEELVKEYMKQDQRIRYVKNTHKQGPAGARNQGMEVAKGKYIAFLDSDDEWLSHHLKDTVEVLENEPVEFCTSLSYTKKSTGDIIEYDENKIKEAVDFLKPVVKNNLYFFDKRLAEYIILHGLHCGHINSIVLKKDILNMIGPMREDLFGVEDMEFMLRVWLNARFCLIKDYHLNLHESEDNIFLFKNKDNIDDPKIIAKLNSHKTMVIKCLKIEKTIIKNSNKIQNVEECIKKINRSIGGTFLFLAYINKKYNLLKALLYYLRSFCYCCDEDQLEPVKKLFMLHSHKNKSTKNKN